VVSVENGGLSRSTVFIRSLAVWLVFIGGPSRTVHAVITKDCVVAHVSRDDAYNAAAAAAAADDDDDDVGCRNIPDHESAQSLR